MEIAQTCLQSLFLAKSYVLDASKLQTSGDKLQLVFTKVGSDGIQDNNEIIKVKILSVPLSGELLLYVQAPTLISKILSLKFSLPKSVTSYPNFFRSNFMGGVAMVLFPPVATAPALSFVPDSALHLIGTYLNIFETTALTFTCRRFRSYFPANQLLWSIYYSLDFPAISTSSSSSSVGSSATLSAYETYKAAFLVKLANRRQYRLAQGHRYNYPHLPFHPSFPSHILNEDPTHIFLPPPSSIPNIGNLWLPPQNLPFESSNNNHNNDILSFENRNLLHPYQQQRYRDTWF